MFTLDQINEIHERFGRQTTLREYLLALKAIGVDKYDSFLTDGHSEYLKNNQQAVFPPVTKSSRLPARATKKSAKPFKLA